MPSPPINSGLATHYLTDLSPKDKPWDTHKLQAEQVQGLYALNFERYSDRMKQCSDFLGFGWDTDQITGVISLRLKSAHFCRVRHCPICQSRRSLMWHARARKGLLKLQEDHPTYRWLVLTLTVRNCPVGELKATVKQMHYGWRKLVQRRQYPGLGYARSLEVTRGSDNSVHPHYHILLVVKPSYFTGKSYLSQEAWTQIWQECLQVDYTPIVHVQAVKPNPNREGSDAIVSAVCEIFKYTTKPSDLIGDGGPESRRWLEELTRQMHKVQSLNLAGLLKQYLSEKEPENLITEEEDDDANDNGGRLYFGWKTEKKRYVKVAEE